MGFFDMFKTQNETPTVNSILPQAARQEILARRLPILNTNKIFLNKGEHCHYIDKTIYEKKDVKKRYVRRNNGYSMPGLFKGTRYQMSQGRTDVVDNVQYEHLRGILYITNQRIIFVGEQSGFEKKLSELVAATPYTNCIDLQFSKDTYRMFVPDGSLAHIVLQEVK